MTAQPQLHPTPALTFTDLSLDYRSKRGSVPALTDLNFSVQPGEFVAVVGPSGCGKSTLLNLTAGILSPTRGQVSLAGKPVTGIVQGLGYVFQSDLLLPWRTVFDNIALPLRLQKVAPESIPEQVEHWIERVGLKGFSHAYPRQLSGGMRKRVAIAQALVHDPALVLMDEPFSALDVQTRNMMENDLLALWEGLRKTVLFITHDLEEAIALADRVLVLTARPGRVKAEYVIDVPRPRDIAGVRLHRRFHELYGTIWNDLKEEVQTAYAAMGRGE